MEALQSSLSFQAQGGTCPNSGWLILPCRSSCLHLSCSSPPEPRCAAPAHGISMVRHRRSEIGYVCCVLSLAWSLWPDRIEHHAGLPLVTMGHACLPAFTFSSSPWFLLPALLC